MQCPKCGFDPIPPTGNCPHCQKDTLVIQQAKTIQYLRKKLEQARAINKRLGKRCKVKAGHRFKSDISNK